jgi:hypothetical protein
MEKTKELTDNELQEGVNNIRRCMVSDCQEELYKFIYDGVFWIKVCIKHYLEFKQFAKDNNLTFQEKELNLKEAPSIPPNPKGIGYP